MKTYKDSLYGRKASPKQREKLTNMRREIEKLVKSAGKGVNWLGRQTALNINHHAALLKKALEKPG